MTSTTNLSLRVGTRCSLFRNLAANCYKIFDCKDFNIKNTHRQRDTQSQRHTDKETYKQRDIEP